jgi:hypothetical protein
MIDKLMGKYPVIHINCPDWMDKPLLYFFRFVIGVGIILLAAIVLLILLAAYYLVGIGIYFYLLQNSVRTVFRFKGGVTLGQDKMARLRQFKEMMMAAGGR